MSELQDLNLLDLVDRYFEGNEKARAGAGWVVDSREPLLAQTLRDHEQEDEGITDAEEIERRWEVDELLSFYGRVELGCLSNFIPRDLPADLREQALAALTRPPVQRYYTDYYPQLLPQLLVRRLRGDLSLEETSPSAVSAYLQFVSLTDEFEQDERVSTFVDFLDDYVLDGSSWTDLREVLASPKRFLTHLAVPPAEQDALHEAVHGYRQFLLFCWEFDDYLQRLGDLPLFRSGAWHYHAYWFEHMRDKLGDVVSRSTSQLLAMSGPSAEDAARAKQGIDERLAAIDRLMSGRYGETLAAVASSETPPPGLSFGA